MSWNYRLIERDGLISIHEVYYNESGEPRAWTENPVAPFGETVEDVRECLNMMIQALGKPVLKESHLESGN